MVEKLYLSEYYFEINFWINDLLFGFDLHLKLTSDGT